MRPFVVATKLVAPPLRPHVLLRPALIARLEGGVAAGRRLTLVSGPPGYGKTTLVASWLSRFERVHAWLSLDEGDDEPTAFAADLIAACRAGLPELPPRLEDVPGPLAATPALLLGPLCNELARCASSIAIVLEDYQAIRAAAVHDLVSYLLAHLPRAAHVVILTREDPPLPLARWRVRDELTEIRAADLCFDVGDGRRFLDETMGLALGADEAASLVERTEGWIAGLQLAALSLRNHPSPSAFIAEFGASDRHIADYLVEEVLDRQSDDVRAFLRATSVLDRLTGALCDALTGQGDGAERLVALEQANAFVVPLDAQRAWYRWHALFAELLRSELDPTERRELHVRAARWFGAAGLGAEAFRHALAGGDPELAATLLEDRVEASTVRGEITALEASVGGLPADFIGRHPRIAIAKAWTDFWSGGALSAESTLGLISRTAALPRSSVGRIACLRAWIANRRGASDARVLAEHACAVVDPADDLFRTLAWANLGEVALVDDVPAAVAALEEARRIAVSGELTGVALAPLPTLAYLHLVMGLRSTAEDLCRSAIAEAAANAPGSPMVGLAHVPLGVALYEADDLVAARQHLALGRELSAKAGLSAVTAGAVDWTEVRLLHALGERDLAWRRLELTARDALRQGLTRAASAMRTLEAELRLSEGDVEGAGSLLDELPTTRAGPPSTLRELGVFTRVRVLLARGRAPDALALLADVEAAERRDRCAGRLVTIDLLAALAHDRAGEHSSAIGRIRHALELGAPEEYRRAFLCEGDRLVALLPRLRDVNPGFVDDLLARAGRPSAPGRAASTPRQRLAEPLSARELEVLRLVAAGLSNGEIGEAMYVSTGTAKWHVHNILSKLGATSRIGVVARARALGLV